MNYSEEKQIIRWVYLTARTELNNTQNCIEKLQTYLRQLKNKGSESLELELMLESLVQFEKTLHRLLKKMKLRMSEGEFLLLVESAERESCSQEMEERVQQLKYQIHENRKAGIFAWELAKELIHYEELLIHNFQQEQREESF